MKEDIKNLEEIINLCKEEINNNDKNITATLDLEDLKSLENLLTRYKQLEEENKELLEVKISASAHNRIMELEEENKQLEAIKDEAIRRYNFESIPVSKVEEKIEELKGTEELLSDEQGYWGGSDLLEQIKVLQVLLEKEK